MTGDAGGARKPGMLRMHVFLKGGSQIRFMVNRAPKPGENLVAFLQEANADEEAAAVKVVHLERGEIAAVTIGPGGGGNGQGAEGTG